VEIYKVFEEIISVLADAADVPAPGADGCCCLLDDGADLFNTCLNLPGE
jgi:hypothetical protein